MIPIHRPFKPDFMAPGPRMVIEGDIPKIEDNPPQSIQEIFDHEQREPILSDHSTKVRYYRSEKALGQLYRAIDEQEFLSDLQHGRRTGKASTKSALHPAWQYVTHYVQTLQWEHLKEWAHGVREL